MLPYQILASTTYGKIVNANPLLRMYVNRTENRVKFKIKRRHFLELWTPETMKLLVSTRKNN